MLRVPYRHELIVKGACRVLVDDGELEHCGRLGGPGSEVVLFDGERAVLSSFRSRGANVHLSPEAPYAIQPFDGFAQSVQKAHDFLEKHRLGYEPDTIALVEGDDEDAFEFALTLYNLAKRNLRKDVEFVDLCSSDQRLGPAGTIARTRSEGCLGARGHEACQLELALSDPCVFHRNVARLTETLSDAVVRVPHDFRLDRACLLATANTFSRFSGTCLVLFRSRPCTRSDPLKPNSVELRDALLMDRFNFSPSKKRDDFERVTEVVGLRRAAPTPGSLLPHGQETLLRDAVHVEVRVLESFPKEERLYAILRVHDAMRGDFEVLGLGLFSGSQLFYYPPGLAFEKVLAVKPLCTCPSILQV